MMKISASPWISSAGSYILSSREEYLQIFIDLSTAFQYVL